MLTVCITKHLILGKFIANRHHLSYQDLHVHKFLSCFKPKKNSFSSFSWHHVRFWKTEAATNPRWKWNTRNPKATKIKTQGWEGWFYRGWNFTRLSYVNIYIYYIYMYMYVYMYRDYFISQFKDPFINQPGISWYMSRTRRERSGKIGWKCSLLFDLFRRLHTM